MMSKTFTQKLIRLTQSLLLLGLLFGWAPRSYACDGSFVEIDGLIDNGNGTYTVNVTFTIAGGDWPGGIFDGTTGFAFSTDMPAISISPPSFTSANGTTLTAVITGSGVTWGDPNSGPYFVAPTDPTQAFSFSLIVMGMPTVWAGSGMEGGACTDDVGTFPCPFPLLDVLVGDQIICEGTPVTLVVNANGADFVEWSNGTTGTTLTDFPTTTTVYTVTATNDCGPVSQSITVTVNPQPLLTSPFTDFSICQGDTIFLSVIPTFVNDIIWFPTGDMNTSIIGDVPQISTTYTAVGTNDCGTSTVEFDITVNEPPQVFALNDLVQICEGESEVLQATAFNEDQFFWQPGTSTSNTQEVSPTDTTIYTVFATNNCGIDSAQFTTVVEPGPEIVQAFGPERGCPGEEVTLSISTENVDQIEWPDGSTDFSLNVIPTTDTTINVTASNQCGDTTYQFDITLFELPEVMILEGSQTICQDEFATLSVDTSFADSIVWLPGGSNETSITVNPNTNTNYSLIAYNDCGEEQVDFTVSVTAPVSSDLELQACEGTTASYEGSDLAIGSTTDFTLTASDGCDSIVSVSVVGIAILSSDLMLESCEGTTAAYEGQDLAIGSITDFTFTATTGCDSIVTVSVDAIPTLSSDLALEACENGTTSYIGQDLAVGSVTDFTLTASSTGCDSIVTVTVNPIPTLSSDLALEACENGTTSYIGQDLAVGSVTDFTLTASSTGCDSIVTVTVNPIPTLSSDLQLEACDGQTAAYQGQDLPIGSITDFTLTASSTGCDSIVTVAVDLIPSVSSDLELQACEGTFASYEGQNLAIGSTTDFTLSAPSTGCDSIVTVTVVGIDILTSSLQLEACAGETANYEGQDLAIGSSTDFSYIASTGCDSVVTVTVASIDAVTSSLQLEACEGTTAPYLGQDLAIGSSADFTLTANSTGCDSIVTVTVAPIFTLSSNLQLEACEGTTASYQGQSLAIGSSTDFTFTATTTGCDSVVTVTIGQIDDVAEAIQVQICQGNSFPYEGQNLTAGSVTDFTFVAANGCDSVVTVSVIDLFRSDLTLETCDGTTTNYAGQDLSIGSISEITLIASNGCDSIVTVAVDGLPTFSSDFQLQACQGTSAIYEGQDLAIGSSTDFTLSADNGCDSVVTVSVIGIDILTSSLELEACDGEEAFYEGQSLAIGSSTDFSYTASTGCDSVVTVTVAGIAPINTALELNACDGNTAFYQGQNLPIGSVIDFPFISSIGCDSIVSVSVTGLEVPTMAISLTACDGSTADYNGNALSIGSISDFTFTAANGCDSIVTVTVDGLEVFSSSLTLQTCPGTPVVYEGMDLFGGDLMDFTLTAQNGCDSVVAVEVIELAILTSSVDLQACEGETAAYNGEDLTIGTIDDYFFIASNGCDSVVTVTVEGLDVPMESVSLQACQGEMATYNGTDYPIGFSDDFTFIAANGCDSIVAVEVTGLEVYAEDLEFQVCDGNNIEYNGTDLAIGTTTPFTLMAQNGCDSVVTVSVIGIDILTSSVELQACEGTTAAYLGQDLVIGSSTDFSFTASNDCDSVVTVTVVPLSVFSTEIALEACEGSTAEYNGNDLTIGTSTPFAFIAQNGCDSIVTVTVDPLEVYATDLALTACEGSTAAYEGQDLVIGSSTPFAFTAQNGCDSIVTVTVAPLEVYAEAITLQACQGTEAIYDGQALIIGSNVDFTFTAQNGCDSVVNVSVVGVDVITNLVSLSTCEGTTASFDGQDLAIGSSTNFSYIASNGCDSIVTVLVNGLPLFTESIMLEACEGSTADYNGNSLLIGSSTDFVFTAENGCDSTVTVMVNGLEVFSTAIGLEACEGSTANYNGTELAIGSTTPFSFTAINGCDSIVTVDVSGLEVFSSNVNLEACEGTTASYNGTDLDIGSSTAFTFSAMNGCDSVVTVSVSSLSVFSASLDLQACEGSTLNYNGTDLLPGSTTDFTLTAGNGCDSVVTVFVEELPILEENLVLQTCEGNGIDYNGTILTAGTATEFTFTSQTYGCDSVVTVFVSDVLSLSNTFEEVIICNGDSTLIFGNQIGQAGNYDETFVAANGCDSTHTITLEVLDAINLALESTATCPEESTGTASAVSTGGLPPYSFAWSNNSTETSIENLSSGSYSLTVTDDQGCSEVAEVLVDEFSIDLDIEVGAVTCFGDTDGSIEVLNPEPDWLLSLDGVNYGNSAALFNIPFGDYTLFVEDGNACLYEESIFVSQPSAPLLIDLPKDTVLELGQALTLSSNNNGIGPLQYNWSPTLFLNCEDCVQPLSTPTENVVYELMITDDKGCTATDDMMITVINPLDVFIPNAFSPNGDGDNEVFMVFSDNSVEEVEEFQVFSRWGALVYSLNNFQPNDPSLGWDGTFKGELMDTGVFVYYAVVRFTDGQSKLFKGDVTLLR
ncbi:MAG: gliding motility-associated C-terminal domain-containing protein [Bacteroidota bacterium]